MLNTARLRGRSRQRRRQREDVSAQLYGRERHDDGPVLADPEIRTAVDRLSARQRAIIHLTYWEDQSADAVAESLGLAPGTVKRHLARARAHLRKALS